MLNGTRLATFYCFCSLCCHEIDGQHTFLLTLGLLMAFLLLIWGFCVAMEHRQPHILESCSEEWSEEGLCDVDFGSSEVCFSSIFLAS